MCQKPNCACHRGLGKFCTWRCRDSNEHLGCQKANHARFHDHYKYYMVHKSTELLLKYCSGMPVIASPKFKGLLPYTPLVYRPHEGYVESTVPSRDSTPEPSSKAPNLVTLPLDAYDGTTLSLRDVVGQRPSSPPLYHAENGALSSSPSRRLSTISEFHSRKHRAPSPSTSTHYGIAISTSVHRVAPSNE